MEGNYSLLNGPCFGSSSIAETLEGKNDTFIKEECTSDDESDGNLHNKSSEESKMEIKVHPSLVEMCYSEPGVSSPDEGTSTANIRSQQTSIEEKEIDSICSNENEIERDPILNEKESASNADLSIIRDQILSHGTVKSFFSDDHSDQSDTEMDAGVNLEVHRHMPDAHDEFWAEEEKQEDLYDIESVPQIDQIAMPVVQTSNSSPISSSLFQGFISSLTSPHLLCPQPLTSMVPRSSISMTTHGDSVSPQCPVSPSFTSSETRGCKRRRRKLNSEGTPISVYPSSILWSKDKTMWHCKPNPALPKIMRNDIEPAAPTQITDGATTPAEMFSLFMSDQMLTEICIHTNAKIEKIRVKLKDKEKATFKNINLCEIKALLGVLIMSGVCKDNHLTVDEMWSNVCGCPFYKSNFSKERFKFIITSLRFDDFKTRKERLKLDMFAHIRKFYDEVIHNCITNYEPGPHLTVDEQILEFGGRCIFKMYIPNKPVKYGIKLVLICDSDSSYCLNAIPYLGKGTANAEGGTSIGEYLTLKLVDPFIFPCRSVTTDNWFTSLQLARALREREMHLVGAIRPKPYLPSELLHHELEIGDSVSVYNYEEQITLLAHKVDPTKKVQILSTLHHNPTVVENKKYTDLHIFYNSTKGSVDSFAQLCSLMSCSRKTRRWPLCVFYSLVNMVVQNSYIIFSHRTENKGKSRRKYALDLAVELSYPHARIRLEQERYLPRNMVSIIRNVFNIPEDVPRVMIPQAKSEKRRRCYLCPSSSTSRTKILCVKCQKSICACHCKHVCTSCYEYIYGKPS